MPDHQPQGGGKLTPLLTTQTKAEASSRPYSPHNVLANSATSVAVGTV